MHMYTHTCMCVNNCKHTNAFLYDFVSINAHIHTQIYLYIAAIHLYKRKCIANTYANYEHRPACSPWINSQRRRWREIMNTGSHTHTATRVPRCPRCKVNSELLSSYMPKRNHRIIPHDVCSYPTLPTFHLHHGRSISISPRSFASSIWWFTSPISRDFSVQKWAYS